MQEALRSRTPVEWVVGEAPDAVPRARRFAVRALSGGAPVDEVALVVTELVTNALLHGRGPVVLRLAGDESGVRVEVQDAGQDLPVLPRHSTEAMTGRGLALVARLSSSWGVEPAADAGKRVWALVPSGGEEPSADGGPDGTGADVDLDALLAAFPDDEEPAEPIFTVELGSVPTGLLLAAKERIDSLVREFTLAGVGAASRRSGPSQAPDPAREGRLPPELAELVTEVVHGFAAARGAIKRQALAAARRGDREVRLSLTLPLSSADAGERYLAALDEADRYARNARLLTLETPPVDRVFRRWYVQTLVDELRAAAAGVPAPPASTFLEQLAEALNRVAPLEAQAARLEVLQRITAELTAAATVEDIAAALVRSATQTLGAYTAHIYLLQPDGMLAVVAWAGGSRAGLAQRWQRLPVTADLPVGAAVEGRVPVLVRDRAELARRFPAMAGAYAAELTLLAAPLVVGDRALGALSLTFGGSARVEEQTHLAFLGALTDITAQALERAAAAAAAQEATDRLRFLASASVALSSTLEQHEVLEALARLVVPRLADWCAVQLLEDGRLTPVALAQTDPAQEELADAVRRLSPSDPGGTGAALEVLRTGVSVLHADVTEQTLQTAAADAEHRQVLQELGASSLLFVPLTGRAGTFGVVTLGVTGGRRRYGKDDVAFVEDLARRAAQAVENASAYREQSPVDRRDG